MSISVLKKPLHYSEEYDKLLGMDSVSEKFPIRLQDGLRSSVDGEIARRIGYEQEVYEAREILVEAWIGTEGRRYRRVLCMKVRRQALPGKLA